MELNIKKVKNLIKLLGLNHAIIAKKLGKDRTTVVHFLSRKPDSHTLKTVGRIAKILKSDPKDLLL